MEAYTIEMLRTMPGQLAALVMVFQIVKQALPMLTDTGKQVLVVLGAIALQVGFNAWGQGFGAYVLAAFNGLVVAGAAMKLFESGVKPALEAAGFRK